MADPIKLAGEMFSSFLEKHDPGSPLPRDRQAKTGGGETARQGGLARAASLTPKKRSQIAKRAANARWKKR